VVYCHHCSKVCLRVVHCANMAEQMEMPFKAWTRRGPGINVLGAGRRTIKRITFFWGGENTWAYPAVPTVNSNVKLFL